MRDYSPLRDRAANAETVLLKSSTVTELLDELEALRATAAPAKMKRNDYPPAFDEAWQAYPARPGANKRATFKAWSARIKAGVTAEAMLVGVRSYAIYIQATGQFLKAPETFFGPDEHYTCDWTPPPAPAPKPSTGGAWWATDATRLAKALEVKVGHPRPGETITNWEGRIRAAIDNGGAPPAPNAQIRPVGPAANMPEQRGMKPAGLDLKALLRGAPPAPPAQAA